MANDLLNELNRNLVTAEELGDKEWAKTLKARIAELEKPTPKAVAPAAAKKAPAKKSAARKATKVSKTAKKSAATKAAKKEN